jgi:hypothetical protein
MLIADVHRDMGTRLYGEETFRVNVEGAGASNG